MDATFCGIATPVRAWNAYDMSGTVLVRSPRWSREGLKGKTPSVLRRPCDGLKPHTPQSAAGIRTEPPVSLPMLRIGPFESATETAEPPLDPPETREGSEALWIGPPYPLVPVTPRASSWRLVLPSGTHPAPSRLSTISAFAGGRKSPKDGRPIGRRKPGQEDVVFDRNRDALEGRCRSPAALCEPSVELSRP